MHNTLNNDALEAKGTPVLHPGQYIRDSVLGPKKLTVSDASKLVGVGRPALSNFLNGHVTLTPEMASRIEIAFGIPAQQLLDMQAAYDVAQTKAKNAPINARPYVIPLFEIKARDIEAWVEHNIPARSRLAVLIRTLIHSTSKGITQIDFPGNDDAEVSGWDGYLVSTQPNPWIPDGISGWEFGTNKDINAKADNDFAKSVKATTSPEQKQMSFIFVTPRHWPGKKNWLQEKKAQGLWKDVRAYDASDLEQWIEQSNAAQAWFTNETRRPSKGVCTLDKCWNDWVEVANPAFTKSDVLFTSIVNSTKQLLISRLSDTPRGPIVIAADSSEEALAFLAQLFGPMGGDELLKYRDRILIFKETGVLPELVQGTKDFIAVAINREVERELGSVTSSMHTIVLYPRNAATVTPHLVLEPLSYEAFRLSLEKMNYNSDDVTRYSNESGRSLTVLRRRLSKVPAICIPQWASDHRTAANLIPYMFAGAWNSANMTDQAALTLLANTGTCDKLEKECQHWISLSDAPLWSTGAYRGVVSKIDLLFTITNSITKQDLERYFDIAKMVLSEDDPVLDLPEDKRWAASIYGKSREFSAALRRGISETLVLLAVHGNNLFLTRIGFDCELKVKRLVRELLTPLKTRILEANQLDLTAYAEAAPDEFLAILEEDLKTEHPESYGLMRPVNAGILGGGCPRTGLLWALEGLAWNPNTLPRTVLILAQLAQIEINDNWVNKPIHSIESIFRIWMPQTAANHNTRLSVLKLLVDKFPQVAWKICIKQLDTGPTTGDYSHKPLWRNDAYGFGEPFPTWKPIMDFKREIADIVLSWKNAYTCEMLCDLIQHIYCFDEEDQEKIWSLIKTWAASTASDIDKAIVREKIRITVKSRRDVANSNKLNLKSLMDAAKDIYNILEPMDLLNKHEWLFRDYWVEESADESFNDLNYQKRDERIKKLRIDALREIYKTLGLPGIFNFVKLGRTASYIGALMVKELLQESEVLSFLLSAFSTLTDSDYRASENLIIGSLRALHEDEKCEQILLTLQENLVQADFVYMLLLAPFRRSTWQIADTLEEPYRRKYWEEVSPDWIRDDDGENNEAVKRLLAVGRPRAAFSCVHHKLEAIEPELLFKLMSEIAKSGKEQPGQYQLDNYNIKEAFMLIDKSISLTVEQKAGLEFAYIDLLSKPWSKHERYRIPNLEKYVEEHPEFFVQAVVWSYKRQDAGEDPPEWKTTPEQTDQLALRGYKLLNGLSVIPGHDDLGKLHVEKLAAWIKIVRDTSSALGRLDSADSCIGKLLSGAPEGEDGVWPFEPVRQVMEDLHSKKMMEGARIGCYNSRGAISRSEGGDLERALADKYRTWANSLQYSYPFVATHLLMELVKIYEYEAKREDTEAAIRERLQ